MKDNSFAMAMEKIVGQAEAELKQEIRSQKRAEIFGRVRGVFIFLAVAAIMVAAFNYRVEIQNKIFSRPASSGRAPAGGGTAAAQQNAATRDQVIGDITK